MLSFIFGSYFKPKRIAKITCIMVLLSGYLFCFTNADGVKEQRSILVINSYHQGLAWTKDETGGIIDGLEKSNAGLSIFVEDMDWKNYPTSENIQHFYDYLKYKYRDKHISVLIATDDAALRFALANRKDLFSDAPVVFCGVNQSGADRLTKGYDNVTGIIEEVDPTDTIKMALAINPSLKNVYVLFDNSESGISTGKIVMDKIKAMDADLNTLPLNKLSYDDLVKNVRTLDSDSIVLVTTYYSDAEGRIVEFEGVSRDIGKNSSVPVYHLYDMGLNNGAFGGNMLSGTLQGMNAAALAVRVLNGESPDSIPFLSPKTTRKVFDYLQLQRFGIPLNKVPKDCEIINKPFSFYEEYKPLVLGVLAAFGVLVAFVCILLVYIRIIRRMRKKLSESNEELTQLYEELVASDEELNLQYDEILTSHNKIKESEERLAYIAYHDTLTQLPNKLSLYEYTAKDIIVSANTSAALLFIDIDNFKYVNDTMGHAFGDQLLIKISERLASSLGEADSVYRLSGDEFIILLHAIADEAEAEAFAAKLLNEFKREFEILNIVLYVSLSIGIALYPKHGSSIEELHKYADLAMCAAKEAGKSIYIMYDRRMNDTLMERMTIEKCLHGALDKNEFELYYQPQLDLKLNRVTGLEALLRWKSPELGFVSPLKFIKIAEDTHFIIPLGTWVLKNACAFLKQLHKEGYRDLTMSVNISILQLLQNDFNSIIIDTLRQFELEPGDLELEITETILMESFAAIGAKLESLREIGVKIALDDFGKGYSSLSYLKQLPISTLKIDKLFIDSISSGEEGKNLTGHIVAMGKSMGLCVVAEGVESQEQLECLIQYECHRIQGFLYSRPVPEKDILELLDRSRRDNNKMPDA